MSNSLVWVKRNKKWKLVPRSVRDYGRDKASTPKATEKTLPRGCK